MVGRRAGRRDARSRGQAVTEFALILPVMLGFVALVLDVSRLYQVWIALESSTRSAAEFVATNETSASGAAVSARRIVCQGMETVPGFDRGAVADGSACLNPSVSVDVFSVSGSLPGATPRHPIASATVSARMAFRPLFVYPFLASDGTLTLGARESFQIVQGR
jgi:Flp pilus assembly protein TadG